MITRTSITLFAALASLESVAAQNTHVPSDTLLNGVTERGRLLAAYDRAAWHATDAFLALRLDVAQMNTMLARLQPDGRWQVVFGLLNAARDTLFVSVEAVATALPDSFTTFSYASPQPRVGPEQLAAAALHTARDRFDAPERAYNSYVLTRADGGFWVYFLPAQQDSSSFLHGADARYLVAADGRTILEHRPMHRGLLNLALPDSAVAGYHTVLLDDVPQDSDVFLVLTRRPRRAETIVTAHYLYQIEVDGTISWRRYEPQ